MSEKLMNELIRNPGVKKVPAIILMPNADDVLANQQQQSGKQAPLTKLTDETDSQVHVDENSQQASSKVQYTDVTVDGKIHQHADNERDANQSVKIKEKIKALGYEQNITNATGRSKNKYDGSSTQTTDITGAYVQTIQSKDNAGQASDENINETKTGKHAEFSSVTQSVTADKGKKENFLEGDTLIIKGDLTQEIKSKKK